MIEHITKKLNLQNENLDIDSLTLYISRKLDDFRPNKPTTTTKIIDEPESPLNSNLHINSLNQFFQ